MNKQVKEIAEKLCDESGCHHKCHDTDDCIVEDEANKLFKQALVEGVNNNIDKTIEQEKQIEEMAMVVCSNCVVGQARCKFYTKPCDVVKQECETLYNAGYRKQSENTNVPTKYLSPSDVRKMSPKEVKENYDLVVQSMKYWK